MIKQTLKAIVFFSFFVSMFPMMAYADKVLFFTPTRVLLNDQDKVEVINITNLSEISRAYKISLQDQVMTYEGFTTPVDTFEYSAKRMLRFVPREFTLEPGQRQAVRIMSRIGPDTQPGDFHTHIRFLEDVTQRNKLNPPKDDQTASIAAPLAYEALIPAVITHGNVSANIGLKDAKISQDPKTGNYIVHLVLTREGNAQGIAYVDTKYIPPGGGEELIATPRRTVYIYREVDERKKDYDFALPSSAQTGGSVEVTVFDNKSKEASSVKQVILPLP